MSVTSEEAHRLAFIKYLIARANEQANGPELHAAAAVLPLHDGVELFLVLASEHHNVDVSKNATFEDYWKPLAIAAKVERLPGHTALRRLNAARVNIKHRGILPSKRDVAEFRERVAAFLEEATPILFKIEFGAISFIDFVEPEAARDHLRKAQSEWEQKHFDAALDNVAIAFAEMLRHYSEHPKGWRVVDPFSFGPDIGSSMLGASLRDMDRELASKVDDVTKAVRAMQSGLRIIALGLDFRKYMLFRSIAPHVQTSVSGKHWVSRVQASTQEDDLQFAWDYVMDSAVVLSAGTLPARVR